MPDMITTLIADDEPHAIDRLKDLLFEHRHFKIVAEARDGTEALEKIVALQPAVAFLDIHMPGVSVFASIRSLNAPPLVVFQTAHSTHAADAFEIDAVDYLMKPVSRERFAQAVDKIMEKHSGMNTSISGKSHDQEQPDSLSIHFQDSIKIIRIAEIRKICYEEGLSFIYTDEGRFFSDRSLNHYEEKLEGKGFFRSNRANLVNLAYLTRIHKGFKGSCTIELQDGSKVDLSRRKAQILRKTLDF